MRLLLTAVLALVALVAPQAAQASGIATKLAQRDSLIHGIAGDERYVFVTEPGWASARPVRASSRSTASPAARSRLCPRRPAGSSSRSPLGFRRPGTSWCSTRAASRRRARRRSTTTATTATGAASRPSSCAPSTSPGNALAFAEDVEVLPNGEYVVSESVFGGLWLVGRDGTVRPGIANVDPIARAAREPQRLPVPAAASRTSGSAACRSRPLGGFAPGAGSLAVRGDDLYLSSTCQGGVQKVKIRRCSTSSRPAAERAAEIETVAERQYTTLESLKGITFNRWDPRDPWIYAGDPFRLQLIRVHSRTGERQVLSRNERLFDFTVSTAFLPPVFRGFPNPLVTASDQEYRWAVLNAALESDQFRPQPGRSSRRRVLDAEPALTGGFTPAHRGGSGPPLVCLHGFTGTWRIWDLVLPRLERHYDVLAPTLVGHAGGPPLPGPVTATRCRRGGRARDGRGGFRDARTSSATRSAGTSRCNSPRAGARSRSSRSPRPAAGRSAHGSLRRHDGLLPADACRCCRQPRRTRRSSPPRRRAGARAVEDLAERWEHIPPETVIDIIRGAAGVHRGAAR